MSSNATTRAARAKAGKCTVCLRRRATDGHSTCATCRKAINAASATRYVSARAAKTCTRSGCGQPALGYLCDDHAAERNERRAKRGWV